MRRRVCDEYRERELFGREAVGRGGIGVAECVGGVAGASASACGVSAPGPSVAGVDKLPALGVEPYSSNLSDECCRAAFLGLTDREYEVVQLVSEGLDNHEIAAAAFISEGTVRNRISAALQKTGCKNRTQLAVRWWQARS